MNTHLDEPIQPRRIDVSRQSKSNTKNGKWVRGARPSFVEMYGAEE